METAVMGGLKATVGQTVEAAEGLALKVTEGLALGALGALKAPRERIPAAVKILLWKLVDSAFDRRFAGSGRPEPRPISTGNNNVSATK